MHATRSSRLLPALAIILSSLACSLSAPEAPPSPTPTDTAQPTPTVVEATATPDVSALGLGPWFVYTTGSRLWVANPDGSGLVNLVDWQITTPPGGILGVFPAPVGARAALIQTDDALGYGPPSLSLLTLPNGTLQFLGALQAEDSVGASPAVQASMDAWAAVGPLNQLAWSSDGRRLAYNSASPGPSSDLFVYSISARSSTQLSNGPTQSVLPVWSPADQSILQGAVSQLHFDQKASFGYDYVAEWASAPDGSGNGKLFDSSIRGIEHVIGWATATGAVLVSQWDATGPCPHANLRVVDIVDGNEVVYVEGGMSAVAFDPQDKVVLLGVASTDAACQASMTTGLYLLNISLGGRPIRVVEDKVDTIVWSESLGLFLTGAPGVSLVVDSSGQFHDLDVPAGASGPPTAAPGTKTLAWTGEGVWLSQITSNLDNPPRQIFSGPTQSALWDPSGQHLWFEADEGIFVASAPSFEPVLAIPAADDPTWPNTGMAWILP